MTALQISTLFVATPTMYYVFFSTLEIAGTAFIVWIAWTWRHSDRQVPGRWRGVDELAGTGQGHA
jgi:hypothetical protein